MKGSFTGKIAVWKFSNRSDQQVVHKGGVLTIEGFTLSCIKPTKDTLTLFTNKW